MTPAGKENPVPDSPFLAKAGYHAGRIVLLARHFAGEGWKSLSIPPGKSKEYEVDVRGRVRKG